MDRDRVIRGRYRLAPRRFEFKLVEGKLIELRTGLPAYTTARGRIFGQTPPPPEDQPDDTIYLTADGQPADAKAKRILQRDMNDFLCVWTCRLAPEPTLQDVDPDDIGRWETELRRHGLPADLPLLSGGGYSSTDLEDLHGFLASRGKLADSWLRASIERRQRRQLVALAPAEWRRAILRRLSLIFRRPQSDPLLQRMTGYFALAERWGLWHRDPELAPLVEQWKGDKPLQRLLSVLATFRGRRSAVERGKQIQKEPFGLVLKTPSGKFLFLYPVRRPGTKRDVSRQKIQKLLWSIAPCLIPGAWFEKRWLAAAVYLGRDYLTKPKKLASRRRTQQAVADHFGLTRRQLTHAIKRVTAPDFMKSFWEDYESRRRNL